MVLLAAALVLGAIAYVLLTGVSTDDRVPTITFEGPRGVRAGAWELSVYFASRSVPLQDYRVQLLNTTDGSRAIFPTLLDLLPGTLGEGQGVVLSFEDRSGVGTLSGGDAFILEGVAVQASYSLLLIWGGFQLGAQSIP